MPIEVVGKKSLEGIRTIWEEQFTNDEQYLSIMFGEIIPKCRNYVHEEEGKIVSSLSLMPMKHICNRGVMNGWYMFGVATLKEYWGRKLAANLIQDVSEEIKREGYNFIFERPANQSLNNYYLNLGFSITLNYIPHSFNIKSQEGSTENLLNIASSIIKEIREKFPKRFEWEKQELLTSLIKIGELDFHNNHYSPNPPQGTFIAVKPLTEIPKEAFENSFFCFPME